MGYYKFSWTKFKNGEHQNYTGPSDINTESIDEFIKPDIKEEKDKNNEINEEVLLLAIKHFLDTSFKKDNDMNKMGFDRIDEVGGELNYNYRGIIIDKLTNNYMDIPNQRYIEKPDNGLDKTIPLSFYFDVSGSMYEYTDFLARISFLLLKNNISILYGYNDYINGVIYAEDGIKTVEELKKILIEDNHRYYLKTINEPSRTLEKFLKDKGAEKCVIFSDFDPYNAVCTLSETCKVYWFCFENRYNYPNYDFKTFRGNVFYTDDFNSMKTHFVNMDNYEYVEKQKKLILDITKRRKRK